ncbi:MAG: DUF1906 domain-containing protein [Myxococcales bacterium]|nr:DUF1906 domain-containing protein [Myxococcales bacterium]
MTTLSGTITSPPLSKGFDTDDVISAAAATDAYQRGYRFCLRYLALGTEQGSSDLSQTEAQDILDAGLALMAVQHVNYAGWSPTASLGKTHGTNAAANAQSVGLPAGINLWCDLEGVSTKSSAQDVIDYVQAWHTAVAQAGYVPGLYVGPNGGLTGDQLYYSLSLQHYWRSGSIVPAVSVRGYQMWQSGKDTIDGRRVDVDYASSDQLRGQVLWLAPS